MPENLCDTGAARRVTVEAMNPTATLDPRFSDAGAVAPPWPDVRDALASAQLFTVTTVRADGRPHQSPVVAVWLDDAIFFTTGPTEQKHHNLRANPHVLLSTGPHDWQHGLELVVEGTAERLTGDLDLLARLAAAWAGKWSGGWQFTPELDGFGHDEGAAHVFRVAPAKVLAFGKNPFSHTRYRF